MFLSEGLQGKQSSSEGGGPRCQAPPTWMIGEVEPMAGSKGQVTVVALLDGLRLKLESQGLRDVVFMVINHQGEHAQRLHPMLAQRLPDSISLYKQSEQQPDVWTALNGKKDDFIIYDRCGRLTHHISLPYSVIGHGHIESAIKEAYCNRMCGDCSYEVPTMQHGGKMISLEPVGSTAESPEECKAKPNAQPDAVAPPAVGDNTQHDHSRHHGHGHQGQHGHGHVFHPRGFGHNHGHHRGNHNGDASGPDTEQSQQGVRPEHHGHAQGQHHLDSVQLQRPVDTQQFSQEVLAFPVRP
uniref:Selenoprotein P n=1 Tax=Fundulus heteroclitus TaxID=8078 RepID=A0A3Q2PTU2_FUNHE